MSMMNYKKIFTPKIFSSNHKVLCFCYGGKFRTRKNITSGFILLEVIVSMIILSVTIGSLMRSFTVSLKALRKVEIATIGSLLAEELIDSYDVVPPKVGETRASFEYKGEKYSRYYYVARLKEEEVDYENFTLEGEIKNFESLMHLTLDIYYEDPTYGESLTTHVETFLLGAEHFTFASRKENAIY